MIKKFVLTPSSTFNDLISELDRCGEGFLPLVDENNTLQGIVTDGDIRRAFLNGQLEIEQAINRSPLTALQGTTKEEAIYLLKKKHKRHLPIVDSNGVLVDVIKLEDWAEVFRPNKVIIMAGGLGSRLGELTKEIPKPMLPVGNKPILEMLINSFKEQGFFEFYISVNHKADIIKSYFEDGKKFGVSISYLHEKKRLGTAGALSLLEHEPEEDFIVINGDILTSINFADLIESHKSSGSLATMGVAKKQHVIQYGVVSFNENNEISNIVEKPRNEFHINAGIYAISPEALKYIPSDEFFDMPSMFELLMKDKQKVSVFEINDYWLDIGLKDDYFEAVKRLKS